MASPRSRRARAAKRRRRRVAKAENDLTSDQWEELLAAWGGCAYCGAAPQPGSGLQKDCVLPIARGGRYTADNVVPACRSCNTSKSSHEVTGWMRRKRLDESGFLLRHGEIRARFGPDAGPGRTMASRPSGREDGTPRPEPMETTMDLLTAHTRALEATRDVVARIGDDQWHLPTPCDDWDVHQVVNHVVSGNWWAGELAAGSTIDAVGDRLDGDLIADGPLEAYDASAAAAVAAFGAPGALEAACAVSYGPVPGEVYIGHRFIDVLIHGWDLAKATGRSTDLDPELVDACWEVAEPQAELLAGSGAFAADVTASEGASLQQRLLALLGRED